MASKAADAPATSEANRHPSCNACGEPISSASTLQKIACNHVFHRACLDVCVKSRPFCPICNARISVEAQTPSTTQVRTRAQSRNTTSTTTSDTSNITQANMNVPENSVVSDNVSNERIQGIVTEIVSSQLSAFSAQMTQLIEQNITASMSRLMSSTSPRNQPLRTVTSPQQMQTLPAVEDRTFRELFGITPNNEQQNSASNRPHLNNLNQGLNMSGYGTNASSDLQTRPDKVLQIMSNWKLKFNGGQNGLSVDNFIYRIEALTAQTLQGNFDLLCGNASSLFDGKANDWFWRYHRSVNSIRWNDLCRALREQYQDSRTDIDLRELIRERKQKPGESFDNFYEAIVALTDRLKIPLSDETLVEILRRNLLPEIQHEILNIEIKSLQFLRDTCRRREFFMQDMRRRHGFASAKTLPAMKRVSELDIEESEILESETSKSDEVFALSLICWNCKKNGHRYQDCLSERTIFCYGCGASDTYKPNCPKCSPKNQRANAPKSAVSVHRSMDLE